MDKAKLLHDRRTARVRHSLRRKSGGRVRLSIFRSSKHIYAQVIDDTQGVTIAAASSVEKELKGALTRAAETWGPRRPLVFSSPSAPSPRASRKSRSTAAATAITVAFVRWRMPRAKADCRSDFEFEEGIAHGTQGW